MKKFYIIGIAILSASCLIIGYNVFRHKETVEVIETLPTPVSTTVAIPAGFELKEDSAGDKIYEDGTATLMIYRDSLVYSNTVLDNKFMQSFGYIPLSTESQHPHYKEILGGNEMSYGCWIPDNYNQQWNYVMVFPKDQEEKYKKMYFTYVNAITRKDV